MDPVKHCEVYRKEGCSHVDGFLCDMETCDILEKFLREKNLKVIKPNGETYCEFSADENCIYIEFKPGYKLSLDRKVIPDLKKFLENLDPAPENKKWEKRV